MSEQKILELIKILKAIEQNISLYEICDRLDIGKDRASILQLTATIRFAGYEVYSKSVWDEKKQKSTRETKVRPFQTEKS